MTVALVALDGYPPLVPYPELVLPSQFARPRGEWSRSDARAVLAWLVGLVEPRTDDLLRRLGMAWERRPGAWLDDAEAGIPARIWSDAFWQPGRGPRTVNLRGHEFEQDAGPVLSRLGEALGLDLGLLLARSFCAELGSDACWIVASHGRLHVSSKLPVLRGRGRAEFDPMLIGLNLARRWIPGHAASATQQGLAALHARWLADLLDPVWGIGRGR